MFIFPINPGPRRFLELQDCICSSTNDNNDNDNNTQKVTALDTVSVQHYAQIVRAVLLPLSFPGDQITWPKPSPTAREPRHLTSRPFSPSCIKQPNHKQSVSMLGTFWILVPAHILLPPQQGKAMTWDITPRSSVRTRP